MTARPRSHASAKKAGTELESLVAAYLNEHVDFRIVRRARQGNKDRGDIANLRSPHHHRVVVECKNTARMNLAGWAAEAEIERGNDDAIAAVVVSKRHGKSDPGLQWVHMTLADLVALLMGERPLSAAELAAIDDDVRAERAADAATWTEENR